MKSSVVKRLLRGLITLLGAGVGAALAMLGLRIYAVFRPESTPPVLLLTGMYVLACLIGAVIFYFLAVPMMAQFMKLSAHVEQRLEKMPMSQMAPAVVWMVVGLLIAALLTQVLGLMGEGILATATAAILYVVLGGLGWSLGRKRGKDFLSLLRGEHRKEKTARKQGTENMARPKVLDTSAIIDGRILDVCRTGFVEGELIAPQFVLDELRHVADNADPIRRARGRRGLDILQKLQEEAILHVDATDFPETAETDVKLLKLAQQLDGAVLTGDYNLSKVAAVAGVRVLNLNDLAAALKPAAIPGEVLTVRVIKEGKEYGQGVAYMPDGTMIIVEGGRDRMNEELAVEVTSVLQTSAGRMIFTKVRA
ncbi:MAG: hypothetical protein IKK21_04740 [Clostridia bacterium]|nr:hypothetical protein [Clostridia bacterium]